MKSRLLIIMVIAIMLIIITIGILLFPVDDFIDVEDGFFYPEGYTLIWTDEKIIKDADVIVQGEVLSYENTSWSIDTITNTIKGNLKAPVIKVQSIFSGWYFEDGTLIKPKTGESYIWFLKENNNTYRLAAYNGIVDVAYSHSIREVVIKPTILNSVENHKINLDKLWIPLTDYDRIDYQKLIKIVSIPMFVDLFAEIGLVVNEDEIVLIEPYSDYIYTEFSDLCGYSLVDDEMYWLHSHLKQDTLVKASIMNENPMPCKPNHSSCFCSAQQHMAQKTITELSYFDIEQEAHVGNLVLNELKANPNLPASIYVGKYNFDYDDKDVVYFCGEFSEPRRNNYFAGTIKNDAVLGFRLEKELPELCAINDSTQLFDLE